MADLHVDRIEYGGTGSVGTPLLMIHGWGMHGGMWGGVAQLLAQHAPVLVVDLPGHGLSAKGEVGREKGEEQGCPLSLPSLPFPLEAIVDELSARFDGPLNLCGWSLGGQIAMRWAQRCPQQVQRLILVASTPSFVRRPDWDCAMEAETLAGFAGALQQNYAQTLRRFLALQVRGGENEREMLAELRAALFSRGEPDLGALQSGLEILRDCDLRAILESVRQPTLLVAGERDTLTPQQASRHMAERMPDATLLEIAGAAHAPFLSHSEEFVAALRKFLKG